MLDDLIGSIVEPVEAGQRQLSGTIERLVQILRPDLYEDLTCSDGQPFLEPLAFLHFSAGHRDRGLEQIFIGYIEPERRPNAILVYSDSKGSFYLPRVGYFRTSRPYRELTVIPPRGKVPWRVQEEDQRLAYELNIPAPLLDTGIELLRCRIRLLNHCFPNSEANATLAICECASSCERNLTSGLQLLRQAWPVFYQLLTRTVRGVTVFKKEDCNSFATSAAPGLVFLNAALGESAVFFMEDLAHQGGHVILNTAAFDQSEFFLVPPNTLMSNFTGQAVDERPVYVAFHGLFTEAVIARSLDSALQRDLCEQELRHELCGRLAFVLSKLHVDLQNFAKANLLSAKGKEFVLTISHEFEQIAVRRIELLRSSDLSNQTYNFDYARYCALNSRDERRGRTSDVSATPHVLNT